MKIELWGHHEHTQEVTLHGSIDELELSIDDVTFDGGYMIEGVIHRDGDIVRLEATVAAPAHIDCARCLEPFDCELGGPFELVAQKLRRGETPPAAVDDDEEESDLDDIQFVPFDEDAVDITRYIRDVLVLSIPVKVLCSDSCRGLCQQCGQNLNEGNCGCTPEPVDDRWGPLSGLSG